MSGHTPGPWRWFGNRSGGVFYLAADHSGRKYVMGFQRYGMNGAHSSFRVGNIMKPAAELIELQVGDRSVRGFKQADQDGSVYRYDVTGIDTDDARLIAAAPELLAVAQGFVAALDGATTDYDQLATAARAAIARATASLTQGDGHGL